MGADSHAGVFRSNECMTRNARTPSLPLTGTWSRPCIMKLLRRIEIWVLKRPYLNLDLLKLNVGLKFSHFGKISIATYVRCSLLKSNHSENTDRKSGDHQNIRLSLGKEQYRQTCQHCQYRPDVHESVLGKIDTNKQHQGNHRRVHPPSRKLSATWFHASSSPGRCHRDDQERGQENAHCRRHRSAKTAGDVSHIGAGA